MVSPSESFGSDLLTGKEAADYLRVSESTFMRLAKEGAFPKCLVGARAVRYRISDLIKYLESCTAYSSVRA
jgi:excisionase family DNA binding protein